MPRSWLHIWAKIFLIEGVLKNGATQELGSGHLRVKLLLQDTPSSLEC